MKPKPRWSPTLVSDGRREKALAVRTGMASLMSNSKWRKLLTALDRPDLKLERCVVKFVGIDEPCEMRTPFPASFRAEKYFETSFSPEPFVAIEWLEWPSVVPEKRGKPGVAPTAKSQDVEKAQAIIEALGSFPIQITASGLRIVGYLTDPFA
jgi:hypothetical protein